LSKPSHETHVGMIGDDLTVGEREITSTGSDSRRSSSTGARSSSLWTASNACESTSEGENPTGDSDSRSSHSHLPRAEDNDDEGDEGVERGADENVCDGPASTADGMTGKWLESPRTGLLDDLKELERLETENDAERDEKKDDRRGRCGPAEDARGSGGLGVGVTFLRSSGGCKNEGLEGAGDDALLSDRSRKRGDRS